MNITIVGASGFVGTRLLDLLKDDNSTYHLRNIDKQQSHFFPHITEIADVRDIEAMKEKLNNTDIVVLLAAEHRDDVSPVSLYYDVNVQGMKNVLQAMEYNGVKRIVFTSSVAIYGLNKDNPNEMHPADPYNHYGKSKWQAELVLQEWYKTHSDWNINILRPTVIFGERNRGNVYNLLHQISSRKFLMVGDGNNKKSMAYVGNIVAFIKYLVDNKNDGYNIYNYVDKPDFTMNDLVALVSKVLNKKLVQTHFPYWLGMFGGKCFDLLAFITRKNLSISSIRVKKFCSTTQFDAKKAHATGFNAPFTLSEGLSRTLTFEFINPPKDNITFKSE